MGIAAYEQSTQCRKLQRQKFKFNGRMVDCESVEGAPSAFGLHEIGYNDGNWTAVKLLSVFGIMVLFCECLCFGIGMSAVYKLKTSGHADMKDTQ